MPTALGLTASATLAALNNAVSVDPVQNRINTIQELRQMMLFQLFAEQRQVPMEDVNITDGQASYRIDLNPGDGAVIMPAWGQASSSRNTNIKRITADFRVFNAQYPLNAIEANFQGIKQKASEAFTLAKRGGLGEEAQNKAFAKVIMRYLDVQRLPKLKGIISLLDQSLLRAPQSASDENSFQGIQYWLPKALAGVTTPGFNGTTVAYTGGTTSTTIGGIDNATETYWNSWTGLHNGVGTLSYVEAVDLLKISIGVEYPRAVDSIVDMKTMDVFALCGTAEYLAAKRICRADSRDSTMPSKERAYLSADGTPIICGVPHLHCPRLDSTTPTDGSPSGETDQAVYFINRPYWSLYAPMNLWMSEDFYPPDAGHPYNSTGQITAVCALICRNRRYGGGVIHKAR